MSTPAEERVPGAALFHALLLGGSTFLLWQAFRISGFQSWSSAGIFPMLAAATMLVTGLIATGALRRRRMPADAAAGGMRGFIARVVPPPLAGGVVAVAGYMLLLQPLGFLLSSLLFLVLAMRLFGSTRWGVNIAVSVASLAGIHLVFSTVFSVVLPKGRWLAPLLAAF
jgi:putative tricarboxylic transport membrane protein